MVRCGAGHFIRVKVRHAASNWEDCRWLCDRCGPHRINWVIHTFPHLTRAVQLRGDGAYDSVFHCHLGSVLLRLGNPDEALKEFDSALQYNIANVDAFAGRGEIRLAQGEIREAVVDLRKVIELDPEAKRASTKRARAALLSLKDMLEKQQADENK